MERVLRNHPAVEDIAVIGIPDETWGEVGCAFVMTRPGTDIEAEALIGLCEGRLARYKWPKQVIFAADFPRTALGKVRKTALREQYWGEDQN